MKKSYYFLIVFLLSINIYAQGIAIQGIARDNTNSAIMNKDLNFDFRILDNQDAVLYREEQQIKTDNFGLFTHVVSTGTAQDGTVFKDINFSLDGLQLVVWIEYLGNNVKVYEQPFHYTPYAHFAKKAGNGVPPGTIVAFLGEDDEIPTGWVKCMGQNISSGDEYAALRAVIGSTLPDLRGRYLKGNARGNDIPEDKIVHNTAIGGYQNQSLLEHAHDVDFLTTSNGNHAHQLRIDTSHNVVDDNRTSNVQAFRASHKIGGQLSWWDQTNFTDRINGNELSSFNPIVANGNHQHRIQDNTKNAGNEEIRPWTVVINYIVKL